MSDQPNTTPIGDVIWLDCGVCGEKRFVGIPRDTPVESIVIACAQCQINQAIERGEDLRI